ncbi:hypothetical protein E1B28_007398 [Marasmius oreades]|uniref:Uncharacterized protein n=1 Tax=Marasmius oreades TaxID=181124 RepID=A0A9P7S1S1_9AGAR|nr:uncharacterized protein E1B28_007398 [Marasmius oreades]KAG7093747.1 hypothetical protein E1B28_007398 [Marasmius oreades]
MDHAATPERSLVDWDEDEVQNWLATLGFPQYETNIKEHRISGDILCMMDQETLKGVGVATVGQRLSILKAVYNLKVAYNIPIEPDSYVPPSEAQDRVEDLTLEKLNNMLNDQAQRLRVLEEENRNLNTILQSFLDDYNTLRASLTHNGTDETSPPLRRQPSFKWAQYVKPTKSPTKPEPTESPHPSPQQLEHDTPYTRGTPQSQITSTPAPATEKTPRLYPAPSTSATDSPNLSSALSPPKPPRQDGTDNLKSFKVSLEDPTYKVLPAALKKYRINNDNWENYAMFICYGSPGNRIERCLSYDEKPLILFQKLKDAKKNPVFMLKHIKDIRSPIVVAQQKHAARKAGSTISNNGDTTSGPGTATALLVEKGMGTPTPGHTKNAPSRTIIRPPKLEVHDLSNNANVPSGLMSGVNPQPGWPEAPGISSPSTEHQSQLGVSGGALPSSSPIPPSQTPSSLATSNSHHVSTPSTSASSSTAISNSSILVSNNTRELPSTSPGTISYAIAIYPYMAEQTDEFDVVVGDTFIILSRARGWWVVQGDPKGTGVVEADVSKQGWVPAGCLLETNQPIASAIRQAREKKGMGDDADGETATGDREADAEQPIASSSSKTPILPLSIISTSFPGIALMDYKKKGEEELDLAKDDSLRVFKRYNHWSYAVKEDGGDRGWVPSWFIGKVANPNSNNQPTPPTPSVPSQSQQHNASGQNNGGGADESPWNGNQAQVSPMSSAFPTR